jgi:hypothetical protein
MQQEYDEISGDVPELTDDELFFRHVIGEDHELLAVDMMLRNALSQADV